MTSTAAVFDETYYLTNNADVVLAISQGQFANALDHYNSFGGKELRQPNATFNPSYYAINNADVLSAVSSGGFANVFAHYQEFGETEGRGPSTDFAGFSETGYLAANADVAAAVTAGQFASGLDHFITFGQGESREGSGVTADATVGASSALTTGIDSITGSSGTDIIAGQMDATAALNTIGLLDSIDGGAGSLDSLTVTNTTANAVNTQLTASNVTNVEIFNYSATGGGNLDFDTAGSATTFNLTVLGASDFSDVRTSDTVNIANGGGTMDSTVTYNGTNVANAADAHTISMSSVTAGADLTLSGAVETVTLDVNGASSFADLELDATTTTANIDLAGNLVATQFNAAGATTVTVTGSGNFTALATGNNTDNDFDAMTTFNAAASTGVMTVLFNDATNATITTGSAADVIDMTSVLTNGDTIDLGAGEDTLRVDLASLTAGTTDLSISNVETLRLDGINTGGAIQMDNLAFNQVRFDDAGAANADGGTITLTDTATAITAFNFTGGAIANDDLFFSPVTVDYDTTTDVAEATFTFSNGGVAADDMTMGAITAANVDKISIVASDIGSAAADELTIAEIDGDSATDIAFTSSGELIITDIDGTVVDTLDFSNATGGVNATLTDSATAVTVTMAAGNDTFEVTDAAAAITIDLGAGNDTFVSDNAADTITTGTGVDTIRFTGAITDANNVVTDYNAASGGDLIDFAANAANDGGAGLSDTETMTISQDDILVAGLTIIDNSQAAIANADSLSLANIIDRLNDLGDDNIAGAGDSIVSMEASDDDNYVAISDGTDTAIVLVVDANGDDSIIETGDVTIIATLQSVGSAGSLTAANFADFL
jgi:hypothetical protein